MRYYRRRPTMFEINTCLTIDFTLSGLIIHRKLQALSFQLVVSIYSRETNANSTSSRETNMNSNSSKSIDGGNDLKSSEIIYFFPELAAFGSCRFYNESFCQLSINSVVV